MSILWLILAIAFAVGVLKVTLTLLRLIFTVGFITTVVLFFSSLGLFLL